MKLSDLPPAAREQATRAVSRQLAPADPAASLHGPVATWYRASARTTRIVPVRVVKMLPATETLPHRLTSLDDAGALVSLSWEDGSTTRYFPSLEAARAWVDRTFIDEIETLSRDLKRLHE